MLCMFVAQAAVCYAVCAKLSVTPLADHHTHTHRGGKAQALTDASTQGAHILEKHEHTHTQYTTHTHTHTVLYILQTHRAHTIQSLGSDNEDKVGAGLKCGSSTSKFEYSLAVYTAYTHFHTQKLHSRRRMRT